MQREIQRRYVIEDDELRVAICDWLKKHLDQPTPEDPQELALVTPPPSESAKSNGYVVCWTTRDTLRPDP